MRTDQVKVVNDWTADGRFIVFTVMGPRELWLLPTFGDRKPEPLLQGHGRAREAKVSPDGRWLAYVSDESGKEEVYIAGFPMPGGKRRVSTNGGAQPVWRPDGKELFYLSDEGQVMAAAIRPADGEPGPAQALFPVPDPLSRFAVTDDGQRFIVVCQNATKEERSITVLNNWRAFQTP